MIRSDILLDNKSIHIKLKKDIHLALREKLLKYNLSMQDFFQEAVDSVLNDTTKADTLLQKIVKKKILVSLERRNNPKSIGALDIESLYTLLDDSIERKDM